MRALHFDDSAQKPRLIEAGKPQPKPGSGELLIRIYAAGITPTELLWYPTTHTKSGQPRHLPIPSHEFSGVVAEHGENTTDFEIGDEVYGMNDWFADGALAEFCVTQPSSVAPKPSHLTHVEAASVPIGALTAWQGLLDRASLKSGERVLVHGGAGAVGLFAVQLAYLHGAHVIATASARNLEFVSSLGAAQVIDYQATSFEGSVRDVDIIFDTVGGDTLLRSWNILKPGGRMITIAASSESQADERVKQAFFIVEPNQSQLIEIGKLLDSAQIHTLVDTVVPLSKATDAYSGELKERQGRGKIIVEWPHPPNSNAATWARG